MTLMTVVWSYVAVVNSGFPTGARDELVGGRESRNLGIVGVVSTGCMTVVWRIGTWGVSGAVRVQADQLKPAKIPK